VFFVKKIALYGKGGIGKSVTVSNISAALAKQGLRVLQIGCDPKADSTISLLHGKVQNTALDILAEKGSDTRLDDLVFIGAFGVMCIEAGGPPPGTGCAGRGIITVFEKLKDLHALEILQPHIILYDVLGDVVCGGFAVPIRKGYAEEIYVVTSGEMMSLYAAGNIINAVRSCGKWGYSSLGGLILNKRNIENEDEIAGKAAAEFQTRVIARIPRSPLVQEAEHRGRTVIEAFETSEQALLYAGLAQKLIEKRGNSYAGPG
jgi:nitrogenase iron protein NifH